MAQLDGGVSLIIGGTSGIGEATAKLFVNEGSIVVIGGRNDARGAKIVKECGDSASFLHVDVLREGDVEAAVNHTKKEYGKVDCVFNNAGSGGVSGPIDTLPSEGFDNTVALLFRGVFYGVKHAARVMKEQKSGCIINTGSVAGVGVGHSSVLYSSCKAAVMHLTRMAAAELAQYNVRVNCVCPGAIPTPIFQGGRDLSESKFEELRKHFSTAQPLRRSGLPEDIANAVLWLASKESSFVTGQSIVVDGGMTLGVSWEEYQDRYRRIRSILSS
jgi:NAD(P)-dependent dehydrogenase (short-subunit alcohol dehydrogenase family)